MQTELNFGNLLSASIRLPKREPFIEWTEANRSLPPSSAIPGKIRIDTVPQARGVYEALEDDSVRMVTIVVPSQLMKTEAMLSYALWRIVNQPCAMMIVQPDEELQKDFASSRLTDAIDNCLPAKELIDLMKTGQAVDRKRFPSGRLLVANDGAKSAWIARTLQVVFIDEIDMFSTSGTVQKALDRARFFAGREKIVVASTPHQRGHNQVIDHYEAGDQSRWKVPCINCEKANALDWGKVEWDEKQIGTSLPVILPETSRYVCPNCGWQMLEDELHDQAKLGYWEASRFVPHHRSFFCNALSHPFKKLNALVEQYASALTEYNNRGAGSDKLKVFYNQSLCQYFEDNLHIVDPNALRVLVVDYPDDHLPEGCLFLTMAVDVQIDRLEYEICGWGLRSMNDGDSGIRRFGVEYGTVMSSPSEMRTWLALHEIRNKEWVEARGYRITPVCVLVDSGNNTDFVYQWCKGKGRPEMGSYHAIKGVGQRKSVIFRSYSDVLDTGDNLFMVSVNVVKDTIATHLKNSLSTNNFVWPSPESRPDSGYKWKGNDRYFAQLTSERPVRTSNNSIVWKPITNTVPQEGIDLMVYNYAAAHYACEGNIPATIRNEFSV